ncbi:phosphate ABC transporter permease PstA [Rhabdothermincola sp.]|uniref:phosphate ABC transporter permease PstA n=1 Tax=Rhabdothermincola sp. TaxID=2820405 RepID=UPI002FDFEAAA
MALVTTIGQGGKAAAASVRAELTERRTDVSGAVFKVALLSALALSVGVLVVLLTSQVVAGWPVLSSRLGDFLTATTNSNPDRAGISQALKGSFWIGLIVVVVAFPIGIGAAVYLEEYAVHNRMTRMIDTAIRNLAGVPSIVYGILGFAVFVKALGDLTGGKSVLAAGLTVAVLVMPIVIITSAEALRAVPDGIREAGFGVGATRWEVIRHHVLPYAAPGILTGTVLSLARALGEAAPLLLVGAVLGRLGSNPGWFDPSALREQFTAMPALIADWAGEAKAGFRANTAAAIVVMLVVVLLANAGAIVLRNRYEKKRQT